MQRSNYGFGLKNFEVSRLTFKKIHTGKKELLLLIIVGVVAGVISGLTLWAAEALSTAQVTLIQGSVGSIDPGGYFLSAVALAVASAVIIKYFCKQAAGSGLPEFKNIITGEMKPSDRKGLVSFRILVSKVIGLILSTGSGLSIGTEGPLVHISACITHLLMSYFTVFSCIKDSASLSRQAFAASAAVGISSAFNAPVGGLLFSIEITSTFYLVTNYGKSFIAATAGAFAGSVFLITQQNFGTNSHNTLIQMTFIPRGELSYQKWELVIYGVIGVVFSYVALMVLKLNQMFHINIKPYCKMYPILICAIVAGITAVVIYFTGAFTSEGVRVFSLASDVLTDGHASEMRSFKVIPPLVGLLISFIARVFITIIAFNLPIPAGIFVPVLLMGALLGRFVGILVLYAGHETAYLPGYALVGGCALAAGVTQTISVAVIAVELTGNLDMLLPCLIASVISASMTKPYMMSVYDRAMMNKGLESLQLLLRESLHGFRNAADIMCSGPDMACIPQNCSVSHLLQIIESNMDTQFPVVDNLESLKLLGTLGRLEIFDFLRLTFHEWNMDDLLVILLPSDSLDYENRMVKLEIKNGIKKLKKKVTNFLSMRPRIPTSSMTDTGNDTHYIDEEVKKNEGTDMEECLKARIRTLLRKDSTDYERDGPLVNREIEVVLNVEENADKNTIEGDPSGAADSFEVKDAAEHFFSGGDKVGPPPTETEVSVGIEKEESFDIKAPYYHIDINDNVDNDEEPVRRSRAMTVVDIIETTVKAASHFLSQIPEAPSPQVVETVNRLKASSVEDELEAFTLRPSTRRKSSVCSSGGNSLAGGVMAGDQDPEVKERVFLAIKKEVKKRIKEETINLSSNNSFIGLETEKDQQKNHDQVSTVTIVPRIIAYVNDADVKNAFREELRKEFDILDCPRLGRISAFPFSVTSEASMEDIYVLIELVKLLYIYVLEDGKLTGVICRKSLLDRLKKKT